MATDGRRGGASGAGRGGPRPAPVHARARGRSLAVPAPVRARPASWTDGDTPARVQTASARNRRARPAARPLRPADRVAPGARARARHHQGGGRERRGSPRGAHGGAARPVRHCEPPFTRAPRAPRGDTRPPLSLAGARAAEGPLDGCGCESAGARARARAVVCGSDLPRGTRAARARAGGRPRARQALLRAPRVLGRRLGDGGAARALRRVGRFGERLPASGVGSRPGARSARERGLDWPHRLSPWPWTAAASPFWERGRSGSR